MWRKNIYRIYTWFLLIVKEKVCSYIFYNTAELFTTFSIIQESLRLLASNSSGMLHRLQWPCLSDGLFDSAKSTMRPPTASENKMELKSRAYWAWWRIITQMQKAHHSQRSNNECIDYEFETEEDIRIFLLKALNILVSSRTITDSGRRMVRKFIIRFEKRNGRLDMVRDQNLKRRDWLWRGWNGPNEFEAIGWRGVSMILKILKSCAVL